MLKNVPHRLKDNTFTDEVRGEVIISKSDFNEINEIRKKQGLDSFANPRNASSVISSGKNPQDIADRRMQFIAYKIMSSEESHNDDSKRLEQLGFKNSGVLAITTADAQSVNNSIYTYDKYRTNFDYPTDGLVISVINKQVRLDLGETTKFPR
jgi:DNA ligase (NAD+)